MAERQNPLGERGKESGFAVTFPFALPGLPVRGQVCLQERWEPGAGTGDEGFRIIVLTRPQEVALEPSDSSLAVCIPGRPPARVAEARARYFNGRLLSAQDLAAEQSVWRGMRPALLTGRIITSTGALLDPKVVFQSREPLAWFQRIAAALVVAEDRGLLAFWNEVLPYARLFREDLAPAASEAAAREQEKRLLERVAALGRSLEEALAMGKRLSRTLGPLPAGDLAALRTRFLPLCQAKSLQEFYEVGRLNYPDLTYLARDLARAQRLLEFASLATEVIAARAYLEQAAPADPGEELALDRASLLEQISAENLFSSPHLWPSLKSLWEWYRGRYQAAYRAYHARYHEEAAALRRSLKEAEAQLSALERLDSIPELGPARSLDLRGEERAILKELRLCSAASLAEASPRCPRCRLSLADQPPRERVADFLERLQAALGEQQQRLSSEAIRQILASSGERRIDRFIKIVQISDLAPLARILDDELVAFLRRLLADSASQPSPVLEQLKRRFPVVAQGQVEPVVAELRALLEQALAQAQKRSPGKQVHLVLE